ncbi:IclR family transcriptional regulator C-terminal domain-containing protein [Streptomyces sp. DSM 44915]|uniref:IclR family transcriptional regulator C-terminal domain-containing protein n=1 Tax=Streptomyces chisholmiae TaxID=3075540 RepID=A0ABU2JSC7_9ACTN|nr:IclR family transcriptional regulator C-terminal domain-containing protein [Streptomyces sp. DSM 44915]MDT0267902.1 IclR family transcriptional regulator C-terminal domain-containing protein [Streptomyces sp. DSM 44915]
MAHTSGRTAPFHSVRYALRVLEVIAGHPDGIRPEELAQATGLPPDQQAHLLRMLLAEGYVDEPVAGVYVPGHTLLLLGGGGNGAGANGESGRRRFRDERLQAALDALRDSLNAPVYLARYQDGELEVPRTSDTPQAPVVNEWVDFRSAAHATAIGKCLLSQLDHDGRQDHLARHRAARLTSRTITDRRVLLSTLERQPPTMPMLDFQEYAVGTLCAAVPLTAGSTVGCLALSLPVGQAHRLRHAAEELNRQAATALLSLSI